MNEQTQKEIEKLGQKEAVRQCIQQAVELSGKAREEGQPYKVLITKDVRKKALNLLYVAFKEDQVSLKANKDDRQLRKYCSGLISNWLGKDDFYAK